MRSARALALGILHAAAGPFGCTIDGNRPADARLHCTDGVCQCLAGYGDCDGDASNGCETHTDSDVGHCGACGRACVRSECDQGACRCDPGYADCDGDPDTVCESDLDRSSHHCGGCGRDCQGGACHAGECQPLVLVGGLDEPRALVLGTAAAFFAEWDQIWSVAIGGPAEPELVATLSNVAGSLAVDGERVYWAASNYPGCEIASQVPGEPASRIELPCRGNPGQFAVGVSHVYWIDSETDELCAVPKAGGTIVTIGTNANPSASLVVDGAHLYWSTWSGILRSPPDGGASELFDALEYDGTAVLHDGELFWVPLSERVRLLRKAEPPDVPTEVAALPHPSESYPRSMAIASDMVYVSNTTVGTVVRVPTAGGEAVTVARSQIDLADLAADSQFVYWLTATELVRLVQ